MCIVNTNKTEAVSADNPASYDPNAFERPSVTVDTVALTTRDGALCVLLVQRGVWPFEGAWALPGGFVKMDEDLDDAARRELGEETNIATVPFMEQLYTFGTPGRDPRTRVISVAYLALLPGKESGQPLPADPTGGTDAREARWWEINALPPLAFDHAEIVKLALSRVRAKLAYTSVAYALLPREFTLTELQTIYEIILAKPQDKRNFRKKMLAVPDLIEMAEGQRRDGAHRPAQLYRFTQTRPVFLD